MLPKLSDKMVELCRKIEKITRIAASEITTHQEDYIEKVCYYVEAYAGIFPNEARDNLEFEFALDDYIYHIFLAHLNYKNQMYISQVANFDQACDNFEKSPWHHKYSKRSNILELTNLFIKTAKSQREKRVGSYHEGLAAIAFIRHSCSYHQTHYFLCLPFIFPYPAFDFDRAVLRKTLLPKGASS